MRPFTLPDGITVRRAAGGRKGAKRWEVYNGQPDPSDHEAMYDAWLGDIVNWQPEDVWDWQPRIPGELQTFATAEEAVGAIRGKDLG